MEGIATPGTIRLSEELSGEPSKWGAAISRDGKKDVSVLTKLVRLISSRYSRLLVLLHSPRLQLPRNDLELLRDDRNRPRGRRSI